MKKLSFLLLCLGLLAVACQKTQETQQASHQDPVIFGQSDDCNPINCRHCRQAVLDSSCCCVITIVDADQRANCINLCGTTSPLPDQCVRTCNPPSDQCRWPMGPVLEPDIHIPPSGSHIFCAAIHHAYSIGNCGTNRITVSVDCGRGPAIYTLNPGASQYVWLNERCGIEPCP